MKEFTKNLPREDVILAVSKKLKTENFDLKKFTLEAITEKHGLLCEYAFLKATIAENETNKEKNLQFFVKYFPREEKQANFAETTGAFKKEIFVYDLFETFKDTDISIISECVPNCYLFRENNYLIFDDLNEESLEMISKHEYLDEKNLLVVLNSIAKLHAASLAFEEHKSKETGKLYRLDEIYEQNLKESLFDDEREINSTLNGILSCVDLFKCPKVLENGEDFKESIKKIYPKIIELSKPSEKYRNVLCHGDLWTTNFLIKFINKKPITCKFVDFQCACYAPPAHDVLFLIYLSTSRAFRKKQLYKILGMYYSFLEEHTKQVGLDLNEILTFNEFLESCQEQIIVGILSAATGLNLCLVENEVLKTIFKNDDMYKKCFYENRIHLIKTYIDEDKMYETRIRESIQDLQELCENMK